MLKSKVRMPAAHWSHVDRDVVLIYNDVTCYIYVTSQRIQDFCKPFSCYSNIEWDINQGIVREKKFFFNFLIITLLSCIIK